MTKTINENITQWVKFGKINQMYHVGLEAIGFAVSGNYIFFLNLKTKERRIYTANNREYGDGVKCFCGHRNTDIFAFSENCPNPRIFIKSYPEFELVCKFDCDQTELYYQNLLFSDQSLLIGLDSNFHITVWIWRTGEKVAVENSVIRDVQQKLSFNRSSTDSLAQLAIQTTRAMVWDILFCAKKCFLIPHKINVGRITRKFTCVGWTYEGGLYIVDEMGCIYVANQDYELVKVIDYEAVEKISYPYLVSYKSGLLVSGPDQSLRYYKKSESWSCECEVTTPESIIKIIANKHDSAIGITNTSNVLLIMDETKKFENLITKENDFIDFCIIHPNNNNIVTLRNRKYLNLFEISTGNMIDEVELPGEGSVVASNPLLPYCGVGLKTGYLALYAIPVKRFIKLLNFYLTLNAISIVYFSDNGQVIVAANLDIGEIFVLEGIPGNEIKILCTFQMKTQIADLITISSKGCIRLFYIPVTSKRVPAGNKIVRYCIMGYNDFTVKEYTLESDFYYYKIVSASVNKDKRDRIFFAIPWGSKMIHQLETKRGQDYVKLTSTIPTGHQLRRVYLNFNERYAVTWSFDGFVMVRDHSFENIIGMALPHHRYKFGVKTAKIDALGQYIIALGNNQTLCCIKINHEINEDYAKELEKKANTLIPLFSQPTKGIKVDASLKNVPWIEMDKIQKTEMERLKCITEKKSILKEFESIKEKLKQLLDENLEGPENEKLDILEFNLDKEKYENDVEENKKNCKIMENYLKELTEANTNVSKWMIENFSDPMKVKVTNIKAIFESFSVENYVVKPKTAEESEKLMLLKEQKYIEESLNDEIFQPWLTHSKDHVEMLGQRDPSKIVKVEGNLSPESSHYSQFDENKMFYPFESSDSYKYIHVTQPQQEQRQVNTFYQIERDVILARCNIDKLKNFFNEKFQEVMSQKQKDFNLILEKNSRLRHIISELNFFLIKKVQAFINDPEWDETENYERMITILDEEVGVLPYISPSQQALLDAEAAEAERIRLLLLADDFKERALIKMMNGVLEIRWEDELKKDVPKPKCMLEKEPTQYNEEDLKLVRDYEIKVKELNNDREKYKSMLRSEFSNIQTFLRETIRKFNRRLNDLLVLKLKVQMCISEEDLKIFREKLRHYQKVLRNHKEKSIEKQIKQSEEIINSDQILVESLSGSLHELRTSIEALQQKDRLLEKGFKTTFLELPVGVQEQLGKLYRKRPKTTIKAINNGIITNVLLNSMIANEKPLSLTHDCLEYLKALENLDAYIPPNIDEKLYHTVVKLRRQRIECEMNLKVVQNQLAEAEDSITAVNKRLQEKVASNDQWKNNLDQCRKEYIEFISNKDLQLIAPMGFVELPQSGRIVDFNDAILIPREIIEEINAKIKKAGEEKLKLMQKTLSFRKTIDIVEWEHKKKNLQIEDLQEKIADIDSAKVNRDMLEYLRGKGSKTSKTATFENEIELMKKSYQRTIDDQKQIYENFMKEIESIKVNSKHLDKKIAAVNVDVCEFQLQRDNQLDEKSKVLQEARISKLLEKTNLVQQIQKNHGEILILQTELELQRLKTYPTLKFKILN